MLIQVLLWINVCDIAFKNSTLQCSIIVTLLGNWYPDGSPNRPSIDSILAAVITNAIYMAKCAICVFRSLDKCMENAWFLPNYNEVKTMRLPKRMENARGTFGHVWSERQALSSHHNTYLISTKIGWLSFKPCIGNSWAQISHRGSEINNSYLSFSIYKYKWRKAACLM